MLSYLTGNAVEIIVNNGHCSIILISISTEHYTVLLYHSGVYFMNMSYFSKLQFNTWLAIW